MKNIDESKSYVERQLPEGVNITWFTRTESGVYKLSVLVNGKIYFAFDRNLNSVISKMKKELRNPKNYPTFKNPCYV